jgi:hypothetical protein
MPYIQKIVEKIQSILRDDIQHIKIEKFLTWVEENMPVWRANDKSLANIREKTISDSKLKLEDFGTPIKDEMLPSIEALVEHYNGVNVFFGVANRL